MTTCTIDGIPFKAGECYRLAGVPFRIHHFTKRGVLLRPISRPTNKTDNQKEQNADLRKVQHP
jgi:hypothetical protein